MRPDTMEATANFLWDTAVIYLQPRLAPHPDDDLVRDLPIDDGDWSMDWPREFADLHGFSEMDYPDWPEGAAVTLRNYGRWLEAGLKAPNG